MQTRNSPSLATLHRLALQASISDYEKMPKGILYKKLQESFDIDRLQRVEARRKKMQEIFLKKRQLDVETATASTPVKKVKQSNKEILNKLDPIMLCPIGKKNTWKFIRPNGSAVMFNVESLVDYILSTGDFTDPETRILFSEDDLIEIDETARKAGLRKSSVLEAKRNPQLFADFKFRRDALLGLERCAGEVVTEILTTIETCDPDEAQMRLIMRGTFCVGRQLPTFADYFRQLRDADPYFARQCLSHWQQFLEGPPNNPNEDLYGLIEVVCHFLRMCDAGPLPVVAIPTAYQPTSASSSSSSSSSVTTSVTTPVNTTSSTTATTRQSDSTPSDSTARASSSSNSPSFSSNSASGNGNGHRGTTSSRLTRSSTHNAAGASTSDLLVTAQITRSQTAASASVSTH